MTDILATVSGVDGVVALQCDTCHVPVVYVHVSAGIYLKQ